MPLETSRMAPADGVEQARPVSEAMNSSAHQTDEKLTVHATAAGLTRSPISSRHASRVPPRTSPSVKHTRLVASSR